MQDVTTLAEVMVFLGFERNWWKNAEGRDKDTVIREALGMEPDAYYEKVYALAATPEAERYDRITAVRLRHLAKRGRQLRFRQTDEV